MRAERPGADAEEADAERPRQLLDLAHVGDQRVAARRGVGAHEAGELELASGLDRDPLPRALERDDVPRSRVAAKPRSSRRARIAAIPSAPWYDTGAPVFQTPIFSCSMPMRNCCARLGAGAKITD